MPDDSGRDGGSRVSIGYARERLGRHEDALEAFDKAIEIDPWYGRYLS